MTRKDLADLMYPHVNATVNDYERKYENKLKELERKAS